MTVQDSDALKSSIADTDRLVAEYRDRIIQLEAHGLPGESTALWDVLGDILDGIKRHQTPTNS